MRLGRRLSSGIADDPPAPVAAEPGTEVPVEAPTPRAETDREYAGHAAER